MSIKFHVKGRYKNNFAATVTYKSQKDAESAIEKLNGLVLVPGADPIMIEFYNTDNRFPCT